MIRSWGRVAVAALGAGLPLGGLTAQGVAQAQPVEPPPPSVEARVWLDRGDNPVLEQGDRVRVYYRTSADGYLAIFHIDTNGQVRLLFPASPEADHFVRGGRDYRLLFPRASHWFVDEDPGKGYYFALASPTPLDFRDFRYSRVTNGWDLSFVGRTVYDDPFVAMDEYIARLIPDWEYADYALDWVEYDVGEQHDYPRFLCYDCHTFRPYSAWNPYLSACTSFRVVIYDDPWYYPVNRYRGTHVVYVRPPVWQQPRFIFKERGVNEPWTPLVQPRPSGGGPGIPGDATPRRTGSGIGSGGTVPVTSPTGRPGTVRLDPRARPSGRPAYPATRPEPSTRVPATRDPTPVRPGGTGTPSTRVPATRPGGDPGTPATRPSTRPGGDPGTPSTRPSTRPGGDPGTTGAPGTVRGMPLTRPPSTRSGTGGTTPTTARPILRRRPTGGTSGGSAEPARSGARGSVVRPPSRPSGGTVNRATPPRSSGGAAVRTPSRPSGGAVNRTPPRSSGGAAVRPPSRPSGGSVNRTPPRSSGGAVRAPARTRPPVTTRTRTPARPPTTRTRTPVRSPAASRPRTPVRSSAGSSRPPTRAPARPPVRRKPGGGGNGEA